MLKTFDLIENARQNSISVASPRLKCFSQDQSFPGGKITLTSRNVGPALSAYWTEIRGLIANASTLEELATALENFNQKPETRNQFIEAQAQSFALAKLAGRSDAQKVKK